MQKLEIRRIFKKIIFVDRDKLVGCIRLDGDVRKLDKVD